MNTKIPTKTPREPQFEPDRFEMLELPAYQFEVSRRDFLRSLGGGLLIAFVAGSASAKSGFSNDVSSDGTYNRSKDDLEAWIRIGEDDSIVVYTGKIEMGQGVRTSLTQALLEELDAELSQVKFVMGDTDLCPTDSGTYGSQTTPRMGPQIRRVGATARKILIDLAAEEMGVEAAKLKVEKGSVVDTDSNNSMTFGEIVKGKNLSASVNSNTSLIPAQDWKISGTSIPKVDARAIVTGKHTYTSDFLPDNVRYGKVLRPPSFGAKLMSADFSEAMAMSGIDVVEDKNFLGVVGTDPFLAETALATVDAKWDQRRSHPSSAELFDDLVQKPMERPEWAGQTELIQGSLNTGFANSAFEVRASYTLPYIAHVPLETRSAVAEWKNGKLTVWVATQSPFSVQRNLANTFNMSRGDVRVIASDMGSGYGGKTTSEYAIEAARLAKDQDFPVMMKWTREEEFTWAYFRPAAVVQARVGVDGSGRILAWDHTMYNAGIIGLECQYNVPHTRARFFGSQSPLRQGSYRAVASTANNFARESAMDESAHEANEDPVEFRRKNTSDERILGVMEAAVERFDWGKSKPDGHGYGIAVCKDRKGYVANCVELSVSDTGKVKLIRAISAFDCGALVNPDGASNQIDGSMIMGIGAALFEEIEYGDGLIKNPQLSKYRVPRLSDIPQMETIALDRKDISSAGAGECGIVAIAPAIANAIFDATGERIRDLPLAPKKKLRRSHR